MKIDRRNLLFAAAAIPPGLLVSEAMVVPVMGSAQKGTVKARQRNDDRSPVAISNFVRKVRLTLD
jgi:hypothetical protein